MPSYFVVLTLNLISLPPMLSLLSSASFISEFFLAVVNSTAFVFSTSKLLYKYIVTINIVFQPRDYPKAQNSFYISLRLKTQFLTYSIICFRFFKSFKGFVRQLLRAYIISLNLLNQVIKYRDIQTLACLSLNRYYIAFF